MTITQQLANLNSNVEMWSKANEFVRMAAYRFRLHDRKQIEALEAKRAKGSLLNILDITIKSPVGAMTTTDSAALAEYDATVAAFLTSAKRVSAFDTMLADMIRLPAPRVRVVASTVAGATAYFRHEGSAKAISSLSLSAEQTEPKKVVAIVILSAEIVRLMNSDSLRFIGDELRLGIGRETDATFLPVLTDGIAPISSSGATALAVRADLRGLLAALTLSASSKIYLLVSPTIASELAVLSDASGAAAFPNVTPTGGEIAGMRVLVSDAVAADQVIAVDASQIAGWQGTVVLDNANHATIQLEDAPDSPPTASTIAVSLWQSDQAAIKAERYFSAVRLRSTAVAMLEGASFSGDSPA